MNNSPNGNYPQFPQQQVPQQQQAPQQQPVSYYQPPSYYPAGYNGVNAGQPVYPNTDDAPHAKAAESTLGEMNIPLFLIFSVVFGWVCARTIMIGSIGAGMTLMGILFYALFLPFILHKQHKKIPLSAWLLFIPQIAALGAFALWESPVNKAAALIVSFIIVTVQTTLIAGCTEGKPFSFELVSDVCMTYLAYPFLNLAQTVKTIFGFGKPKDGAKKNSAAAKVGVGLLISIPVVIILIIMLSHADEMFAMWVQKIIEVLNISFSRILADVLLTFIVMLYVMPLVVTLRSGYRPEHVEKAFKRMLDPIVTSTVLFSASVIYLVFVAVQFRYLFATAGSLPDGFTYAEYCRRGFFELVLVTGATALIVALVCMLTRHNDKDKLPAYTKAALLIITVCAGVMTVSAISRLVIYVRVYGMTVSRFNAGVIIGLLALCVVVTALKILFEKLRVSAIIGTALIVVGAAYAVCNVDGLVARYNIDRYLAGGNGRLDIGYIKYDLSLSALPELDRMAEIATKSGDKEMAKQAIRDIVEYKELRDGFESVPAKWTLSRYLARSVMDKYGVRYQDGQEYRDSYDDYWNYRYGYDYYGDDYEDYEDYDDYDNVMV